MTTRQRIQSVMQDGQPRTDAMLADELVWKHDHQITRRNVAEHRKRLMREGTLVFSHKDRRTGTGQRAVYYKTP